MAGEQIALFPYQEQDDKIVGINDRCWIRHVDGDRFFEAAGLVLAHIAEGDRGGEAYASINLMRGGWASQTEIARALSYTTRTLRRWEERYDKGGTAALGQFGYPRGRPRNPAVDKQVLKLKADGLSTRAIARRVGVTEKAIRKRLKRLGWKAALPEQLSLALSDQTSVLAPSVGSFGEDPKMSVSSSSPVERASLEEDETADPNGSVLAAFPVETLAQESSVTADPAKSALVGPPVNPEPVGTSGDDNPSNRRWDRLLACLGLLDDAAPLFQDGAELPYAGVLLALPVLHHSGIFAATRRVYGSIGPAFYGLRTTVLTLLLMALLRIKRPEALKEHSPSDLGRILGLDRAPEVKTLRLKLARLAARGEAEQLGALLAERRAAICSNALGFLYIDGHVRVYHGIRELPKAHVTRLRMALPATTDYWVNDQSGDPILLITAEANAGLVKILPKLLDTKVRPLLGDRRATIVFDRGGYSPKLFEKLIQSGFDLVTYRKGPTRRVPLHNFTEHTGTFDGEAVCYQLADRTVSLRMGKRILKLRQITRLKKGHQTHILTSRFDLSAVEIAYRMFKRWRQENYFKYAREEFLLDALVDYKTEPDDPTREVPNPAWAAASAELKGVRHEIALLQEEYGAAALSNSESTRPTMRGFKIAMASVSRQIRALSKKAQQIEKRRARTPRRIPVSQRTKGEVLKLATERKHLTSLIKMVAYQAESDLFRLLAPLYRRNEDEGRTLLQTALRSAADIAVTDTELRITLAPLSSPHRSRAIAELCDLLNSTNTLFPGTALRLHYAVKQPA